MVQNENDEFDRISMGTGIGNAVAPKGFGLCEDFQTNFLFSSYLFTFIKAYAFRSQ